MVSRKRLKNLLEFLEKNKIATYQEIADFLGEEIAYKDGRNDSFMRELHFDLKLIERLHEPGGAKKETEQEAYESKLNRRYRLTLNGLEYLNSLGLKELQSKQVGFNKIIALAGSTVAIITILGYLFPKFELGDIFKLQGEFFLFIALISLLTLLLSEVYKMYNPSK